jgi:hypothetical protein
MAGVLPMFQDFWGIDKLTPSHSIALSGTAHSRWGNHAPESWDALKWRSGAASPRVISTDPGARQRTHGVAFSIIDIPVDFTEHRELAGDTSADTTLAQWKDMWLRAVFAQLSRRLTRWFRFPFPRKCLSLTPSRTSASRDPRTRLQKPVGPWDAKHRGINARGQIN